MIPFLLVGIVVLIALYVYYQKTYRYWQRMGVQPVSNYPCIFLGDFWPIFLGQMNFNDIMDKFYYKRPTARYEAVYHLMTPSLMIRDCELIKQLLVKEFDSFTDHFDFAPSDGPDGIWGQNLLNLKGNKWKEMRSVLSGAFTSSKMKVLYGLISQTSENFVEYFKEREEEEVIEVEFRDCFRRLMTDIVATTAFGIKVDSLRDRNNEFYELGKKVTNFQGFGVVIKFFLSFLFPKLAWQLNIGLFPKDATEYFYKVIDETLTAREKQGIIRPDMLHLLLQVKHRSQQEEKTAPSNQDGFAVVKEDSLNFGNSQKTIQITNKNIVAQALTFFVAGFETTSNAMCFTAYELAVNPEIQEKLRKEIEKTLQENDGKIDYEALIGMKYLDMVVTESLRKWPPIMATDRVCVKPFTITPTNTNEIPITVQPEQRILIPFQSIQRDPNHFPDPEKFDPERFSDLNKHTIHPYSFLSFGVGPRGCLGSRLALLDIKTILVWILRNFQIVATDKTPVRLELDKKAISTSVKGGFPLGLKRLNQNNS
ncbi:cytochrome P450 9e2-like [Anthonomus grandis grandis]|uniref:cytochrome P450 9e2-like n=1 Tax=Anthonomus grandis grandis TaxID=2921223 RepID=UPI0021668650|nr:cytochrome P450 9e2-like [Anthonomus grandis grandis]